MSNQIDNNSDVQSINLPDFCYEDDMYDTIISAGAEYFSGPCTGLVCFDKIPQSHYSDSNTKNITAIQLSKDSPPPYFDTEDINEMYEQDNRARYGYDPDDESTRANSGYNTPEDIDDEQEIYGYNDIPSQFANENISINDSIIEDSEKYKEYWFRNDPVFNGGNNGENKLDEILSKNANEKDKKLILTGQFITKIPEILLSYDWVEDLVIRCTGVEKIENLPPKLISLTIENNIIEFFDGSTLSLSLKSLKFTSNKTKIITGLNNGLERINLGYNFFNEIDSVIPASVIELKLDNNVTLKSLPKFEDDGCNLKILDISHTKISNIDDIPCTVQSLSTCGIEIQEVNKLPADLTEWKSYKCVKLRNINCEFPKGVIDLDFCDCALRKCPDIPQSVKRLDLSKNILQIIPDMPLTIDYVDLKHNEHLPDELIKQFQAKMPSSATIYVGDDSGLQLMSIEDDEYGRLDEEIGDCNQGGMLNYRNLKWERNVGFDVSEMFNYWRRPTAQAEFTFDCSNEFSKTNPHYIISKKTYTF